MLGQNFTMQLQSNTASTGYQWQPTYNTSAIKLVNHTYIASSTALLGAPGADVFTFQGLQAGTSVITFNYVSPANQTTNTVTYTINCTTLNIPSVNAVLVSNGTNFTIQQLSNPSTGYQWRLDYTNDTITLVNQTFVSNASTSSTVVGAGGTEVWTFQATATGSAGIVLSEISPASQTTTTIPYLVLIQS
jgi:predicted secreted protein